MKLNEKILLLRKKAGMSQEELADKLDVSRQAIYKWESENSKPEMDKIRALTKLFNVSFDYLMNDNIDTYEENAEKKFGYRPVFNTGIATSIDQFDLDHGYTEKRKKKLKNATYHVDRRAKAQADLKAIGASEIIFLQQETSIAFFCDNKKKIFGFYYLGQVQFVCPVENAVGFRVERFPHSDKGVWATLTYRDGNDIKEYCLTFSVLSSYTFYQNGGNPKHIDAVCESQMYVLLETLRKLQLKLFALREEGTEILAGRVKPAELDYPAIQEKNKETQAEFNAYVKDLETMTSKENKRRLLRNLIIWGIVIVAVTLLFI